MRYSARGSLPVRGAAPALAAPFRDVHARSYPASSDPVATTRVPSARRLQRADGSANSRYASPTGTASRSTASTHKVATPENASMRRPRREGGLTSENSQMRSTASRRSTWVSTLSESASARLAWEGSCGGNGSSLSSESSALDSVRLSRRSGVEARRNGEIVGEAFAAEPVPGVLSSPLPWGGRVMSGAGSASHPSNEGGESPGLGMTRSSASVESEPSRTCGTAAVRPTTEARNGV